MNTHKEPKQCKCVCHPDEAPCGECVSFHTGLCQPSKEYYQCIDGSRCNHKGHPPQEEQPKDDFEESNLDYTKWTPTGESSVKLTVNKSQSWEEEFYDRFTANNAKMSREETMLFEPTTTLIKQFIQAQINLAVQKEKEQLTKKIIKFDKQKRRTVMKADSQPKKVLYIWCQAQEEFTQDIIAIINNKKEEES